MILVPLRDNVLIELSSGETQTESGIILKQTETRNKGVIAAVGPDEKTIKEGDIVFFRQYGIEVIKYGQKNYVLTRSDSILAIEKKE